MSLIVSISGLRGTLGPGKNNLNFKNVYLFLDAFLKTFPKKKKSLKIVLGRDGRASGEDFSDLIIRALLLRGHELINLDLATTPTVEMAVIKEKADGGIIITASHNPIEWNGLKFLNRKGEFFGKKEGVLFLNLLQKNPQLKIEGKKRAEYNYLISSLKKEALNNFISKKIKDKKIGHLENKKNYHLEHIQEILKLKLLELDKIKKSNFKIVVDPINSVGALAVPDLLKSLGLKNFILINKEIGRAFKHNPEPLDKNLKQLSRAVLKHRADLGLALDPDGDRLSVIDERGQSIGEEYVLVAIADYVFKNFKKLGNKYKKISVSNLSSSQALKDVSEKHGAKYYASAVGELNVVRLMKKTKAVIGGEGNGGIIYPELHYGRDALLGIALFLSYLSQGKKSLSQLKKNWPNYFLLKERVEKKKDFLLSEIIVKIKECYQIKEINQEDGLKIFLEDGKSWFHLRSSNTEDIIRLYIEAPSKKEALNIFKKIKKFL